MVQTLQQLILFHLQLLKVLHVLKNGQMLPAQLTRIENNVAETEGRERGGDEVREDGVRDRGEGEVEFLQTRES